MGLSILIILLGQDYINLVMVSLGQGRRLPPILRLSVMMMVNDDVFLLCIIRNYFHHHLLSNESNRCFACRRVRKSSVLSAILANMG